MYTIEKTRHRLTENVNFLVIVVFFKITSNRISFRRSPAGSQSYGTGTDESCSRDLLRPAR